MIARPKGPKVHPVASLHHHSPSPSPSISNLCPFPATFPLHCTFRLSLSPSPSPPIVPSMASSDPLDVMDPPVDGLSHITLVAPTADLFYSTVQFYESLGFKAVCLVSNPLPSDSLARSSPSPLISFHRCPFVCTTDCLAVRPVEARDA